MSIEEPVSIALTAAEWLALSGWICGRKHLNPEMQPARQALDSLARELRKAFGSDMA
jgi:hypothetical protein